MPGVLKTPWNFENILSKEKALELESGFGETHVLDIKVALGFLGSVCSFDVFIFSLFLPVL